MELNNKYNPHETENKWLNYWKTNNIYQVNAQSLKKPFTIMIPPPNVTGILHMGHALNNTLQDILIRYHRMKGKESLWMPGTDHAGIATQNVVEKQLAKEGKKRQDFTREEFLEKLWAWKKEYGGTIIHQLEKLGSSCDWSRTRFTMDEEYCDAVNEAFVRLYHKGLIYQGNRIINWCPRCQTALSDEEAEHQEKQGKLYHIKYLFKDNPQQGVIVATTRPETMLGDTAVAVNPDDERYVGLKGKLLLLPILGREIPIIHDEYVAREFGSGAVKVTPAHDPNDFAMGQRHQLKVINVMYPDGRINEHGGKYHQLDRFEARKQIIADLNEQGLLVKVEDHQHAVGHCYRCDTVVEPYLSKQWFVKMKPLAQPALKAVKDGTLRIRPERFEKVYINWMEGIRDWCISRQIWWGHRIPVWYDQEGNVFCAKNFQEALALARQKHGKDVELKQDEDVLDTWFSSWLWPFATLGWPKQTPDLEKFYPTNTLFTAAEIIFFWVARMVMAGYEFMGQAPFTDVYIHGTVRDAKGRKMSKSLGNALDPLEIISEYGADALRFSLIINSGQDIFISKEKFEIGRNFANKLWNASRLILINAKDRLSHPHPLKLEELDLPSRWILVRLATTIDQVSLAIEQYRYSEAEVLLQDFFWGDFCDWYLELIKPTFNQPEHQQVALLVLQDSLKILHPFMPFVTEELYSYLSPQTCLSVASWPSIHHQLLDAPASSYMQVVIDFITAIRAMRVQWGIKPQDKVNITIIPADKSTLALLKDPRQLGYIQSLAKIDQLIINDMMMEIKDAAIVMVGPHKVFMPLGGLVDLEAEKKRLHADLAQKQKAIASLEGRLNNQAFVSKAPVDVITKERERLAALTKEQHEIQQVLASLS